MTEKLSPPPIPDRPLLRGEKVWLRPLEERDLPADRLFDPHLRSFMVRGPSPMPFVSSFMMTPIVFR